MAPDAGKAWEAKFKADWQKQFPNGAILRLPDQVSGYKHTSRNPCDFVCYAEGVMLLVECKECAEGTTIGFYFRIMCCDEKHRTGFP